MAKVLVIDQDPYMTNLLLAHLSVQGFEVLLAQKGQDGLGLARQYKPDLIIMDAILPDVTGFQLSNQLRRDPQTQSIPVIMLSGLAQFANQQQFAQERGINELIPKPVKVIELGEIVDRYIGPGQTGPIALPAGQNPSYSVSTDIHAAMSEWLGRALTREEKPAETSETQTDPSQAA